jgi:hypothetical protein
MAIQWNQETFEELTKGYTSWTDFLSKYPQAQTIAKRGKIDPWKIFKQGGGKLIDGDQEVSLEYWIDKIFTESEGKISPHNNEHRLLALAYAMEQIRCAMVKRERVTGLSDDALIALAHSMQYYFKRSPMHMSELERRNIPEFLLPEHFFNPL